MRKSTQTPHRLRGQKLSSLQSPQGKTSAWLASALFWLAIIAQATVFVAAGKVLDLILNPQPGMAFYSWLVLGIEATIVIFVAKFFEVRTEALGRVREDTQLRSRILASVFSAGPARVKPESTGKIITLATNGAEKYAEYSQWFLPQVKASFTAPIVLLVFMGIFVDPLLAVVMLFCTLLIPLAIGGFMKLFRKASGGQSRTRSQLATAYLDALGGLTTLRLLGADQRMGEELRSVGERNRVAIMRVLRTNQIVILVMDLVFSLLAITAAALLLLWEVNAGAITLGAALSGIGLALCLLEPIDHFGAFFYVAMGGRGSARGILGLLASLRQPQPTPSPGRTHLEKGTSTGGENLNPATQPPADPQVPVVAQVRDVSFTYDEKTVLSGVNLQIRAGERVAIVGPSGQGKTTLLHLLKGFLSPAGGTVSVNGKPVDLVEQSALVSQQTWLFTGTVRENLLVAAPQGAQPSDSELWQALAEAHLEAEVRTMPQGLDTVLGENGIGFSSGQKQRLSLARALVSGRKILLLDEATSQVDLASEREILAALAELGREYTLIMVTHRQAATDLADRVLRVENREVVPA